MNSNDSDHLSSLSSRQLDQRYQILFNSSAQLILGTTSDTEMQHSVTFFTDAMEPLSGKQSNIQGKGISVVEIYQENTQSIALLALYNQI